MAGPAVGESYHYDAFGNPCFTHEVESASDSGIRLTPPKAWEG